MRSFRRALLSILCVLAILAAATAAVLGLYYTTEYQTYTDSFLRRDLAGSVDFLVLGSSHAENGVVPAILDEELGVNSYNISGWVMPMAAKRLLLEKELARNPIRTVVIEIAYDTLSRSNDEDFCEGDEAVIARLDTMGERLAYMRENLSLNQWADVYSRAMFRGAQVWLKKITGAPGLDRAAKGYFGKEAAPLSLRPEEIGPAYQSEPFSVDTYRPENAAILEEIVRLCREAGAEPVVVTVPVSERFLWVTRGQDEFLGYMRDLCGRLGCPYWDFDLWRGRFDLLDDDTSFRDLTHLSDPGARAFTPVLAACLREAPDPSLFFDSYAEALEHSAYCER